MWCPWLYKPMNYSSREKFPDFHLYQKRMRASSKINRKLLPKELFICSGHFKHECFKRDLKVRFDFSEKSYFSHFNEKGY